MSKPSPAPASDPTAIQRLRLVRQAMTKPPNPTPTHTQAVQGFKAWFSAHPSRRISK
jgi:hypothetical protein